VAKVKSLTSPAALAKPWSPEGAEDMISGPGPSAAAKGFDQGERLEIQGVSLSSTTHSGPTS